MRIHLIEGDGRRTHSLPTMEEVAAIILIKHFDRNSCDIVLNLTSTNINDGFRQEHDFEQYFQRISQTHAAYMPTHYVLLFPHETYGRRWSLRLSFSLFTATSSITVPGA
ncbi:hypothetical protein BCV72DRAFT_97336 [Rhizopus microsporus var. microsporus]|uniref:Uncharacterized protein n=2 Tax=Rhizopus microsporus TaxID=58291 RepID=A0A2G4SVQ8_RHIZD|nr:uncharacterized protein RHIMIDRAFT_137616 [Rhizopus microsporus ATCC 52813]ORE00808.1 hypothetical protein BCV72DRAFT_97336 [Rhizopus microsporus var. microsporus]PHZ12822.1 hypothetical protein RHIMIDRAFT_137616 [Rhizopus microsporus ATCC 52813]